jgi:hypothetical protein
MVPSFNRNQFLSGMIFQVSDLEWPEDYLLPRGAGLERDVIQNVFMNALDFKNTL